MPDANEMNEWQEKIRSRYANYLRTSFYFKDADLRESFRRALDKYDLLKGQFPEPAREFEKSGVSAGDLARARFQDDGILLPSEQLNRPLYGHQEQAIRAVMDGRNIVVATGTASGKTESFLYPILFDLYEQHKANRLGEKGVRALILYPMNALANDQRRRLGEICQALADEGSSFAPTFGQYIGETPLDKHDHDRHASRWEENRMAGELIYREEMRRTPPHILLTNYSMLEYLLIRPEDSDLFDKDSGGQWRFIVLDEAHQYRGTRGMEMGMLVRRLKQRLRDGGRGDKGFSCIATSATIASKDGAREKEAIAGFAQTLFGESFSSDDVFFGKEKESATSHTKRFHLFVSALEGAFLTHANGKDSVVLNRAAEKNADGKPSAALEIALCRECGQHYYVGRERDGHLEEAMRDPSNPDFGVDFYLPNPEDKKNALALCRQCGKLSPPGNSCDCGADILVEKCKAHENNPDQLKECASCGYWRGSVGDPVQEIVHGSDGPNSVIATALHQLLPEGQRKVLSFADNRQEAAFFAWYAEDTYGKLRDRNFMLRALEGIPPDDGVSLDGFQNRLAKLWGNAGLFLKTDDKDDKKRKMLKAICREALTDERRISLAGVGLMRWHVAPPDLRPPREMFDSPWRFNEEEARELLSYLLDRFRFDRALELPDGAPSVWEEVCPRPQMAYCRGKPGGRKKLREWGGVQSSTVRHFLFRMLPDDMPDKEKKRHGKELMSAIWGALREHDRSMDEDADKILARAPFGDGTFVLNPRWLRAKLPRAEEIYKCGTCASLSFYNIRRVCPRDRCQGLLDVADEGALQENHYRRLYMESGLPASLKTAEHTAQVDANEARERQEKFKDGGINLLSSSTTFEVGVDLGDLEVAFLRNVPPEPFNYTQRVGRVGRRNTPGLALTYCRRNPHDLYHYANPEERVMKGKVNPPQLQLSNDRIILRHITATALSAFFKDGENAGRFRTVEDFVKDWDAPRASSDFAGFCRKSAALHASLRSIVPKEMWNKTGLDNGRWVDLISADGSTLHNAESDVCGDYREMRELEYKYRNKPDYRRAGRMEARKKTIATEKTLVFLSRKAVIPKYGFPVDVVELDTRPQSNNDAKKVSLQRDLSQAIAEYAPGSEVVANKKVWKSRGVKKLHGKEFRVMSYSCDNAHNFKQWQEEKGAKKYLSPEFGFVTPLEDPKDPTRKPPRLYTTRTYFSEFVREQGAPESEVFFGVQFTRASPGRLVVLCEGKGKDGFYICRSCGAHYPEMEHGHETPEGRECLGTLDNVALGHEFVTDVVRLQFPGVVDMWGAYSLAYAVLLGAAEALSVPGSDLNVTITGEEDSSNKAIVLYDNVPGGAGLAVQLEQKDKFLEMLHKAHERVSGDCGCDISCYGCLRSYRNQFAHPHLNRKDAEVFLSTALKKAESEKPPVSLA